MVHSTSYNANRMHAGTEYEFRVSAENAVGLGPPLLSARIVAKDPYGKLTHHYIVNTLFTWTYIFIFGKKEFK